MGWDTRTQKPTTTNTCAILRLDELPTSQSGMSFSRLPSNGAGGASLNGEPPTRALTVSSLFSTVHQRGRHRKLPKCSSLLRRTELRSNNAIEQWFRRELAVSYEASIQ